MTGARPSGHLVSRRTLTTGAAWAVPAVAMAQVVPAFAASQAVIAGFAYQRKSCYDKGTSYTSSDGTRVRVGDPLVVDFLPQTGVLGYNGTNYVATNGYADGNGLYVSGSPIPP